jgi:hypothetical protein
MLKILKSTKLASLAAVAVISTVGFYAAPAFAINGGSNPPDYPPISDENSSSFASGLASRDGDQCWVQRQTFDRQGHSLGESSVNVCGPTIQ